LVGPSEAVVTERQPPEALDRNGVPVLVCELTPKSSGGDIEGIDPTVPEVADEQVGARSAEIGREGNGTWYRN